MRTRGGDSGWSRALIDRLLVATLLASASPPALAQDQPSAAASKLTARIAVAAPLQGVRAALGRDMHAAARLVAADLAARYPAVEIVVTPVDDPCSSASAHGNAETLAGADVDAVIGFPCAASAAIANHVFARASKLLVVTAPLIPGAALARMSAPGATTFRLPVAAHSLGQFLGTELAAVAPVEARFAIVRDKTRQATTLATAVDEGLKRNGRPRAALEVFSGGDKAFGAQVARLKALGITHVVLLAYPVEAGLLMREIVAAMPDAVVFGPDILGMTETPLIAGRSARNLHVVLADNTPFPPESLPDGLAARVAAAGFSAPAETQAVAVALSAYVDAVSRAGSVEPTAVAAALRKAPAVSGRRVFDAAGGMVVPYGALYRWNEAGKLVKVSPAGR